MAEKIYVGAGKNIDTQYGKILKMSMSKSDVEKITQNINEKGYVNISAMERKEVDKFGNTHYLIIDNYKK